MPAACDSAAAAAKLTFAAEAVRSDPAAAEACVDRHGLGIVSGALSPPLCAALRESVLGHLGACRERVASGADPEGRHFGKVASRAEWTRVDLKLPLALPGVRQGLRELLGVLGPPLLRLLGAEAMLCELAALISFPGAPGQPFHADTCWGPERELVTCFVALQDVSPGLGPTEMLAGTHSAESHVHADGPAPGSCGALPEAPPPVGARVRARKRLRFDDGGAISPGDEGVVTAAAGGEFEVRFPGREPFAAPAQWLCAQPGRCVPARQRPIAMLLRGGSAALMDSRLLHRGTANTAPEGGGGGDGDGVRALFYFSAASSPNVAGSTNSLLDEYRARFRLSCWAEWTREPRAAAAPARPAAVADLRPGAEVVATRDDEGAAGRVLRVEQRPGGAVAVLLFPAWGEGEWEYDQQLLDQYGIAVVE